MSDSVLQFSHSKPLTLGVELELQLLDKTTLDLSPKSPLLFAALGGETSRIKAEIFQSMLEINTAVCQNAHEVRRDLSQTISTVQEICASLDLRVASAGTHPFAHYSDRILYPADRYKSLIDRNQWIARRLMIFGLHVHIGMRDGEHAIQMNNALLHYLPILLALSASSPYWNGEDTELASSRITFFEAIPTGGHPCRIMSWGDFTDLYAKLIRSGAIRSPKDIWWDMRPSPGFGTLEIRICDSPPTLAETVAITALIHSIAKYIDNQIVDGRKFAPPPDWIVRENKWRASRWGTSAEFIVTNDGETDHMIKITSDLLDELAEISSSMSYQAEFDLIRQLLAKGPSYKRQQAIASRNENNMVELTDFLASEFELRSPIWGSP
ncbi:MAG: YbdK family carboxylate-amine ligase [Bdellovibrionaceae bacterium]|nr:YbdK family carboxylate-amine ligase [Pseudobdellovibrionaceae bacterium]